MAPRYRNMEFVAGHKLYFIRCVCLLTVLEVRNPGSSFYIGGFAFILKNYQLTSHVGLQK